MRTLQNFFKKYAEASTNNKVEELAAFYDEHFLMIGPGGSLSFSNDRKFLNWLKKLILFNKKSGLRKMTVRKVNSRSIGKILKQATVSWRAVFAKTNNEFIEFKIHYILSTIGNEVKIVSYASDEDPEKLMREKGII